LIGNHGEELLELIGRIVRAAPNAWEEEDVDDRDLLSSGGRRRNRSVLNQLAHAAQEDWLCRNGTFRVEWLGGRWKMALAALSSLHSSCWDRK